MTHRLRLHADLSFSVQAPAARDGETVVSGTVTGEGPHVDVTLDDVSSVSTGIPGKTRRTLVRSGRAAAALVAEHGITVTLRDPQGPLVSVGAVRPTLLTRMLTRSPHLRIHSWSRAIALLRTRRRDSAISLAELLPPGTPWPPTPTFRMRRRILRTTHDPRGGGRPRLVLSVGEAPVLGATGRVFYLKRGTSTIGSDPSCDLVLSGLEAHQAEVVRMPEEDEYVLVAKSAAGLTRVNGEVPDGQLLRTGSRIQLGEWTVSYSREEYADHGRPFGGRAGGEFSRQKPQQQPAYKR